MTRDARLIVVAQGVRGFVYGLGVTVLGVVFHQRGYSPTVVGLLFSAVVCGMVSTSLLIGRVADQWGRRRCYGALYVTLGVAGVVVATCGQPWVFAVVGLGGVLSTDIVESGPFSSLEQSMLADQFGAGGRARGYGIYNAVASASGSLGALATSVPGLLRRVHWWAPSAPSLFLVLAPAGVIGLLLSRSLSSAVEVRVAAPRRRLSPATRPVVRRLAALFAVDSFGGGFVVQSFIAYWLARRFDATAGALGVVFFAVGLLQTASLLLAARVARRVGLLATMVGTHLPSNVLLAGVAFAPNWRWAIGLLLARTLLSQMDVPTRQAYVMSLVGEDERTGAAVYTNAARYVTRPVGPTLAGLVQSWGIGLPFLIAGALKSGYDLALWRSFRHSPVRDG